MDWSALFAASSVRLDRLVALQGRQGGDAGKLCASMRAHGFCVVDVPHLVDGPERFAAAYRAAERFFALPLKERERSRDAIGNGYLENDRALCFQLRPFTEPSFPWPEKRVPELKHALHAAFELLDAIARICLEALASGLGVPPEALTGLLDSADSNHKGGGLTVDRVSETALRLLAYPPPASRKLPDRYADHTDNSLITVAARGSVPGLEIKLMKDPSQWVAIETALKPHQVVVFIGDMLSRLTCNYYPAALHRPTIQAGGHNKDNNNKSDNNNHNNKALARFSMPYFLRARMDAVLDSVGLNSPVIGPVPAELRQPVSVAALAVNAGGERESWPWKRGSEYYSSHQYTN